MSKTSSVEDIKQTSTFQSFRKTLLQDQDGDRLDRPIAYWALPGDRRLPLAFLGRRLGDLLNTPFDELSATQGIGRKKIGSLLKLLARASKDRTKTVEGEDGLATTEPRNEATIEDFNPALVSESLWEKWRETVRRHGLGYEKLGRLAPALTALPTVIWHATLSQYLDYSVAEMRQLKTHGEKRIRVVLEVFHAVHKVLGNSSLASNLSLRFAPKFVAPVELWIARELNSIVPPSSEEVLESLAVPLVEQVQIDCGPTIVRLVEGRLGIHQAPQSVKIQAKRLGVTRARVYQLLEECEHVMDVRWPEGRGHLLLLQKKLDKHPASSSGTQLLRAVVDLFFPDDEETARRKRDKLAGK